jgi:hypothetical protein
MTRPVLALLMLCAAAPAGAWNRCKYEDSRDASMAMDGVAVVEVFALAGELDIRGEANRTALDVKGRACASSERVLQEIQLTVRREGERLLVAVEMPDRAAHPEWDNELALLDLEIRVPSGVALVASDSSGELVIAGVAALELSDSSGDAEIRDVPGTVLITRDSSGDLEIENVGELTIELDSSGDIDIVRAASVTIGVDSSGDIDARDVSGDVTVGVDSSGDILATRVAGNFSVGNDTSGRIVAREVRGTTRLPENKR